MSKDYAAGWRERAARLEAERPQQEEPTGVITLDGFEFVGRRLPLERWIKAGRVPQSLTAQMIRVYRGEQPDLDESQIPTDDLIASHRFVREVVTYVVVEPRLVTEERALAAGEVRYSEVFDKAPHLVDLIMQWVYAGSPGVPVRTEGGETSIEALSHFPDDAEGGSGAQSGADVPELRRDAGGAAAAA
jgi:hypothetical protein